MKLLQMLFIVLLLSVVLARRTPRPARKDVAHAKLVKAHGHSDGRRHHKVERAHIKKHLPKPKRDKKFKNRALNSTINGTLHN
uniref:Secreted protein n=1 Tax=Panagrellus redivivus TaxID=6233 RepID=A0A7E4VGQ6_PANRE